MRRLFLPAVAAAIAATLLPLPAHAKLPKGAMPPTLDWLLGAWASKGGKCSETATVYLPGGRMGSITSPTSIFVLGRYSLRGNILTQVVESKQYGDLVDTQRIGRMGPNDLQGEYPGNTDPNTIVLPMRRCPDRSGFEPWFPKVRFKGVSAYTITGR